MHWTGTGTGTRGRNAAHRPELGSEGLPEEIRHIDVMHPNASTWRPPLRRFLEGAVLVCGGSQEYPYPHANIGGSTLHPRATYLNHPARNGAFCYRKWTS